MCVYMQVLICVRALVSVCVSVCTLHLKMMTDGVFLDEWMDGLYVYGQQQTGSKVKKDLSKVVVIMND